MNKEKNKHDHKLTNLLKVGIFALLMVAPLFASVSQLMYATFNKNAYQSYSGKYTEIYQTNDVNSRDDIILGNIYQITINSIPTNTNYTNIAYLSSAYNITNANGIYDLNVESNNNSYSILFRYNSSFLTFSNSDNYTTLISIPTNQVSFPYTFNLVFKQVLVDYDYSYSPVSKSEYNIYDYNDDATLDNAFYYGVEQMTESDLFNWTENTTIYTGIKGMTDNLEIQTNAIAILLTYWTILTIVYVIFDILIQGFTFITHKIVE